MGESIIARIKKLKDITETKTTTIHKVPVILLIAGNESLTVLDFIKENQIQISYVCSWEDTKKNIW